MTFILIVWLWGSHSGAPPILVDHYSTLLACEQAGRVWETSQTDKGYVDRFTHHACVPHQ